MENVALYIQDESMSAMMIKAVESHDLHVIQSHTLEELFQILSYDRPVAFVIQADSPTNDSHRIIRLLKKSRLTSDIPILGIIRHNEDRLIETLIDYGVTDILLYPCLPKLAELRFSSVMRSVSCYMALDDIVQMRMKELQDVQSVMIESLATLAEYRDPETGEHIKRTQNYVKALAQQLVSKGLFTEELTPENIELIYLSVPLHDIGKVGIRDDVLLKPGKLTKEEYELMKTHTTLGHEAILKTGHKITDNAFLRYADDVAYTHQEKFDGTGYPRGLKGNEIPLIGRMMAIADVYDALISKRVYKEAIPHEEAIEFIRAGIGTHFDPIIAQCALEIEATFHNIALTYQDTSNDKRYPDILAQYASNGIINRVLLVDDSRIIRGILKNQLISLGFIVDEAEDGLVGLEYVKSNSYDLIMADVEMPNLNGYDFSRLARDLCGDQTLIIIMTASDYNVTEATLKHYGVQALLLKPVDLTRLEFKIEQLIEKRNKIRLLG